MLFKIKLVGLLAVMMLFSAGCLMEPENWSNKSYSEVRAGAEQGNADAQFRLGVMYLGGAGVAENYAQAYVWYNVAAAQGSEQSSEGRDVIAKNLSPSLLNKAQQQSQRCIDSGYQDCDLETTIQSLRVAEVVTEDWSKKSFEDIKAAAEQGLAEAQYNLGVMYFGAISVAENYTEAVWWWRLAAEQGYARAQFGLGVMYGDGMGVAQSYTEAVRWYRLAAEQGDADAQYNLGGMYYTGIGVAQNYAQAYVWFNVSAAQGSEQSREVRDVIAKDLSPSLLNKAQQQSQRCIDSSYQDCDLETTIQSRRVAEGVTEDWSNKSYSEVRAGAEQGNADAQFRLGVMYELGQGVAQNYTEAERWYQLAAEQGVAYAQFNLGQMYRRGTGVAQNNTEAVRWIRLAAEQGYARAQDDLGVMYELGQGVAQSYTEAVRWYRLAAEQGNVGAQSRLGSMYSTDYFGVAQNDAEAVRWYRLAAEQGNAMAQHSLGQMYRRGTGVAQSDTEAVRWIRLAAEQGHFWAQRSLGTMYRDGIGVEQDYTEAVRWYRLAAEQRQHVSAQFRLGVMYFEGTTGVAKNYAQAYVWFNVAAARGYEYPEKLRDLSAKQLSPSLLNKAQQQSQRCIDSGYKDCDL